MTKRCVHAIILAVWVLMLSVSPAFGEGKQAQAQELVQFDRAIFDTGTQNSGAILQDKDGFLWIGTNGAGLYRYDGYELKAYKPGGPNSLSSPYVYALYEDRDGIIWIGTGGGGLDRYDKETTMPLSITSTTRKILRASAATQWRHSISRRFEKTARENCDRNPKRVECAG